MSDVYYAGSSIGEPEFGATIARASLMGTISNAVVCLDRLLRSPIVTKEDADTLREFCGEVGENGLLTLRLDPFGPMDVSTLTFPVGADVLTVLTDILKGGESMPDRARVRTTLDKLLSLAEQLSHTS